MPKVNDYPQASFEKCLELADAVESLGGSSSNEVVAHKLGKQPTSGGFSIIIGSTSKFGLVENRKGNLSVTERYKEIKLAYTPEEKSKLLAESFLLPPVFKSLFEKFKGRELPLAFLPKMLIREFNVEEAAASRVSGYFVEGVKQLGLIDDSGCLQEISPSLQIEENVLEPSNAKTDTAPVKPLFPKDSSKFSVSFLGPELNHSFAIKDEEDFEMIEVLLRKIKRALKAADSKNSIDNNSF